MSELILSTTGINHGEASIEDVNTGLPYGIADTVDSELLAGINTFDTNANINCVTTLSTLKLRNINTVTAFVKVDSLQSVDASLSLNKASIYGVDASLSLSKLDTLKITDTTGTLNYYNSLPAIDLSGTYGHHAVNVHASKINTKPDDGMFIPTSDFNIGSDLIGFTSDFIEPIDYDKIKTPLSPVDSSSSKPWDRLEIIDIMTPLNYGYSLNDFLIGGSTNTDYLIDEDATIPPLPPFEPITGEVITIVNIINVVVLPSRTPIDFTDFTLARDIDSVAWVASFDIASKESLALIKPQGLNVKEVEIDINGEKFNIFIGRTSTGLTTDDTGKLVRRIKCTGWSNVKMLSFPYHSKRSHTETSPVTPSGILSAELTGTGFTGSWDSVDWTLPANVFSYFDKAPLAAIAELAESVGAVVKPDRTGKSFSVVPRYSVSPWNWATTTPDYQMGESQFFTIDTEWIPQEAPDSIYVYGEEHGAAVKCVKQGTAGLITLPTVVDKHITDTIAGTERGRIEVAKAGFKEIIPVTTYIDGNGIIELQKLIEVTDLDGGIWYGMVVGTSLSIKRNGNAIVQSLQIERHYD